MPDKINDSGFSNSEMLRILVEFQKLTDKIESSAGDTVQQLQSIAHAQSKSDEDLARLANEMHTIRRIVTGSDGANGLASEVRDLKRDIQELKAEDARLSRKIEELANSEKEKTKIIFDWGWKILVFLAGLMFSILGAVKAFKELFKG